MLDVGVVVFVAAGVVANVTMVGLAGFKTIQVRVSSFDMDCSSVLSACWSEHTTSTKSLKTWPTSRTVNKL